MPKFRIGFTLTTTGHVAIEANTESEAEDQAQEFLEHQLNAKQLVVSAPELENVTIDDNEVEVW